MNKKFWLAALVFSFVCGAALGAASTFLVGLTLLDLDKPYANFYHPEFCEHLNPLINESKSEAGKYIGAWTVHYRDGEVAEFMVRRYRSGVYCGGDNHHSVALMIADPHPHAIFCSMDDCFSGQVVFKGNKFASSFDWAWGEIK